MASLERIMLTIATILIMLTVASAGFREGVFTELTMLVNVILAGLLAFNFFEPLSQWAEPALQGTLLDGVQDFFFLVLVFALSLGILRLITNNLAFYQIDMNPLVRQLGGGIVGLVIGYLASGFLISAMETLPLHHHFLGFQPRSVTESGFRRFMPPDRVWLALMRHAGAYPFAKHPDNVLAESPYRRYPTFDRGGSYELRYLRYRRYDDSGQTMPYFGELDRDVRSNP
jgi:uncharacterized membrane protein required for colicin V production